MERKINNLKEMKLFAQEIAASLNPGDVVGLVGELGAGKTTFVQYLAKALGVKARVNSPTFLVMRMYPVVRHKSSVVRNRKKTTYSLPLTPYDLRLVHIDAYRLKNPRELEALGATEYIGASDTITVIEWADRVKTVLPKNTRWINLFHGKNEGERTLSIS